MAKIKFKGMDEIEKYLDYHDKKSVSLAKRCVYTGAYAIADEVRQSAENAIKKDREHTARQTGEMLEHFGVGGIQGGPNFAQTSIGFSGYDSRGVPVPLIAAVLESGNSTNSQQATHFFSKAVRSGKPKALGAMQKLVDKFMENEGDK